MQINREIEKLVEVIPKNMEKLTTEVPKKVEKIATEIPKKVEELAGDLPNSKLAKTVGETVSAKEIGKRWRKTRKELGKTQQKAVKNLTGLGKDLSKQIGVTNLLPVKKKNPFPWLKVGAGVGIGTGLAFTGLAFLNDQVWKKVGELQNRLPGEPYQYESAFGKVYYRVAGNYIENTPAVLVHGIGAGNNSYEWLQNYGELARHRPVYAYDLLGFGNSDKPAIKYTAETYIQQLKEFLEKVVGKPAIVIASSLSASYAVQVAYQYPNLIERLVLVEPTGLNPKSSSMKVQVLPKFTYLLLRTPVLGKSLYSMVAARSSIRAFIQKELFQDPTKVTDDMVEHYYASSHQPGSELAPVSFFTGFLNAEIGETIKNIRQPVFVISGGMSRLTPVEEVLTLKEQNPSIRVEIIPDAKMLVQWEQSARFNQLVEDYLNVDVSSFFGSQPDFAARNYQG
jgi:pimeloyl-ACP methyl ester carboxylesterase